MSYDVTIADKYFNYTSNVSKLFYDHIPAVGDDRGGIHALNGKTGAEAAVILSGAFNRMNETRINLYVDDCAGEPRMSNKYDAPNGWGSMIGAIIFLGQIMGACAMNPTDVVSAGA